MKQRIINMAEKYWWAVLGVVGVLVYILAMILAYGQSVWFDEGYSILLAKQNVGELLALTSVDAHPPFYYLLLKLWGEIFGFSEFALRSLSALLAAGAVVLAVSLVKRLFGIRMALVVIPFVIMAPFVLRYAYEIRMYSLALIIGVAGTYALVLERQTKKLVWWGVYAALVALGMLTLYMMILVWLAHLVWLIVVSVRSKTPILQWKWIWAYVVAVGLFAPYLPTFIHQLSNSVLPGVGSEVTLTTLVDIATVLFLFTPEWMMSSWLSVLMLVMFAGLMIVSTKVLNKRNLQGEAGENWWLVILLATLPVSFFVVASAVQGDSVFIVRYLAHVSIWIYLFVGLLMASILIKTNFKHRRYQFVAILTVMVLSGGVLVAMMRGNFVFERVQTPHTKQIRADLNNEGYLSCGNDDVTIVADDPYTYIDSVYYFEDCDMRFYALEDVEKKGGYAPLHASQQRVGSYDQLTGKVLVHLHWGESKFIVDSRYEQVASEQYDKQHVDVYRLTEE